MRRIVAVLGVLMLLLGVKLYEVEPADCGYAGERTAFEESIRYDFNGGNRKTRRKDFVERRA